MLRGPARLPVPSALILACALGMTAASLASCATDATGRAVSSHGLETTARVPQQGKHDGERPGWRGLVRDDHAPPPKAWSSMDRAEKKAYMRDVVVPTLAPLFLAFDGERYANFGCKTCHGRDARETDYAMPNGSLFTLHPTGTPEQKRVVEQKEETARFMFNAVTPTMRQLLGAARYDDATGEGFSCFSCHPNGGAEMTAERKPTGPAMGDRATAGGDAIGGASL